MNFTEVMDLHRAVAGYYHKNSNHDLKLSIYHIQSREEGYLLYIKTKSNVPFLDFLKKIAQTRKLELRTFRGFFVIHSYGDWSLRDN
jgi:hypothetical protein